MFSKAFLRRQRAKLGLLHFLIVMLVMTFLFGLLPFYLIYKGYWSIVILYSIWYYFDRFSPQKGGYRSSFAQSLPYHRWTAQYFPVKLHITSKLSTDKNYIFGFHPHGIAGASACVNFGSNGTGVLEKLPGLNIHLCTLPANFLIPLRRELLLLYGYVDSSLQSIYHILTKKGKGNVVVIVIGGAEEALNAYPGKHELTLANRKGFVKAALKTGASLVPVYSFGENDLFTQVPNDPSTLLRRIQGSIKKAIGFSFPLINGRGFFQNYVGLLPYRREVNTVVGEPIEVTKNEKATQEEIDNFHQLYITKLIELFEKHKVRYGEKKSAKIVLK